MNIIPYILLAFVRFPISFLLLIVSVPLIIINLCLTGDFDHDKGIVGWVCFHWLNWLQTNINQPIVRLHKSYKPVAWTFKESVAVYMHSIRWWANRAANNHEYRQRVRANVNCAKNKKEKRYWQAVKLRMDALIAKEEKA